MLTPAHIAVSYIISQVPRLWGIELHSQEIITIVLAGNIVDVDFIVGTFLNKNGDEHHNFITHTPLFALILWFVFFVLFNSYFSPLVWILLLISGILHLVLDDIGYWFCKLGWQEISKYPQINWLYPLRKFAKRKSEVTNKNFLKFYFSKAKINVVVEFVIIVFATVVFLTQGSLFSSFIYFY